MNNLNSEVLADEVVKYLLCFFLLAMCGCRVTECHQKITGLEGKISFSADNRRSVFVWLVAEGKGVSKSE